MDSGFPVRAASTLLGLVAAREPSKLTTWRKVQPGDVSRVEVLPCPETALPQRLCRGGEEGYIVYLRILKATKNVNLRDTSGLA